MSFILTAALRSRSTTLIFPNEEVSTERETDLLKVTGRSSGSMLKPSSLTGAHLASTCGLALLAHEEGKWDGAASPKDWDPVSNESSARSEKKETLLKTVF